MKLPLAFSAVVLLAAVSCPAQFSTRYDSIVTVDAYTSHLVTSGNNHCIFLSRTGPHYLTGTDTAGHLLFTTELQYPNNSQAVGLIETSDSNYVTLVNHALTGNVIQYAKFDTAGHLLWKKCLTSFAYNNAAPYAICPTNNGGGVIVGGGCNSSNMTTRFDANGNVLWKFQYRDSVVAVANAVDVLQDGTGFIVVDRESAAGDYFPALIGIDSAGTLTWSHRYYTSGYCLPSQLIRTNDGGYLLAGMYSATNVTYSTFLARFDSGGAILWSNIYDSGTDNRFCSVAALSGGSFVFTETRGNNLNQVCVDSSGNFNWGRMLDNTYYSGACVKDAGNGNFYTAGASRIHVANLVYNRMWLSKSSADSAAFCNSVGVPFTVIPFPLTYQPSHVTQVNLNFGLTTGLVTDSSLTLTETSLACPPVITAIPENSTSPEGIFPNPVTGNEPLMSRDFIETGSVTVYDMTGQLLLRQQISGTSVLLENCSQLVNGAYFVKVETDGQSFTAKLLICR